MSLISIKMCIYISSIDVCDIGLSIDYNEKYIKIIVNFNISIIFSYMCKIDTLFYMKGYKRFLTFLINCIFISFMKLIIK